MSALCVILFSYSLNKNFKIVYLRISQPYYRCQMFKNNFVVCGSSWPHNLRPFSVELIKRDRKNFYHVFFCCVPLDSKALI